MLEICYKWLVLIIGKKEEVIQDLSRRIDDLNATVNGLTEKIRSVSHELGMILQDVRYQPGHGLPLLPHVLQPVV